MTRTSSLDITLKDHETNPHDDSGNKCTQQQL